MGHYVTDLPKTQMRRYADAWAGLPTPRFQLRWAPKPVPKSDKKVAADARMSKRISASMGYEYREDQTWECFYEIVLPVDKHDIRNEHYEAGFILIPISTTRRGSSPDNPPSKGGNIDTPYRDGAHALWDSKALNWLPIYVVAPDGSAQSKTDYFDAPAEWTRPVEQVPA